MANTQRIEDVLNAALQASGAPLGGQIASDEDDLFAEMMAEADAMSEGDETHLL